MIIIRSEFATYTISFVRVTYALVVGDLQLCANRAVGRKHNGRQGNHPHGTHAMVQLMLTIPLAALNKCALPACICVCRVGSNQSACVCISFFQSACARIEFVFLGDDDALRQLQHHADKRARVPWLYHALWSHVYTILWGGAGSDTDQIRRHLAGRQARAPSQSQQNHMGPQSGAHSSAHRTVYA